MGDGAQPGPDDPTPEEIRRMCEEIQKTWSARERYKRAGGDPDNRVWFTVPQVGVARADLRQGGDD